MLLAEREGFEPPDPRRSTVFKTAAFDRSAIFPCAKVRKKTLLAKYFLYLAAYDTVQQGFAADGDVLVGGIEVASVPWVGHGAAVVGDVGGRSVVEEH